MLPTFGPSTSGRIRFDADLLDVARCDARGVPLAGRRAETSALFRAGATDLSLGRLYEGHVNGVQLVARCGTKTQREGLERDLSAGRTFGVWNTEDEAGLCARVAAGGRFSLHGSKTWASGAGRVERPVVTAREADGGVRMFLVPMDRVHAEIDSTGWHPLGMHDSESFRVGFDGVVLAGDAALGIAGDYERQPWFFGGAFRYVAVQAGAIERLVAETVAYLLQRGRERDPYQRARIGQMRIAVHTARHWVEAGADAWSAYDERPSDAAAGDVIDVVDMSRTAVERAALETIENAVRCVGAHGLVEPHPFARIVRDLQMYLRQPAPDAALARIGAAAFRTSDASRNAAIASSTGTGS